MAAPIDGYGQYPPQDQYEQPDQQGFEAQNTEPGPAPAGPEHGKKKKRGYATQAFEFGAGSNVGAGGPMQGGPTQPYGMPPIQPAPAYGGYPAQDQQAVGAGYPSPQPYGIQQPAGPAAPGVGGYQAPEPYYPPAAGSPVVPQGPGGVGGITQGMSQMQVGGGPAPMPINQQARPMPLNQLYPTDLLSQPLNVAELDLPPPAIILPPNVCQP